MARKKIEEEVEEAMDEPMSEEVDSNLIVQARSIFRKRSLEMCKMIGFVQASGDSGVLIELTHRVDQVLNLAACLLNDTWVIGSETREWLTALNLPLGYEEEDEEIKEEEEEEHDGTDE
jgi:hypothetical protein